VLLVARDRTIARAAPPHLLDGNPECEQDAGAPDEEREETCVEWDVVGERNDRNEEQKEKRNQGELFAPITLLSVDIQ
jgi:hypothetical protein